MELINILITFFGLDYVPATFGDFLPWFVKLILAMFLICYIFKCLFTATWKLGKELR